MARYASGGFRFLPFIVAAAAIAFVVFAVASMRRPWWLLFPAGIAVFLAVGYWTWGRTWGSATVERRDRLRRWGLRRRVDTGDRTNVRRK